nr:choice-of-anchor Q domain-containing protein [Candidatus Chloroploca sp. Khr17]
MYHTQSINLKQSLRRIGRLVAPFMAAAMLALLLPGLVLAATFTTTVDTGTNALGDAGAASAVALKSNGLAVISYWDKTAGNLGDLKVAFCNDPACSNPTIQTIGVMEGTRTTSVALTTGDVPVISYPGAVTMNVAFCNSATDCSSPTIKTLDTASSGTVKLGEFSSLAINSSGFPVVSYDEYINLGGSQASRLKVAFCQDATCNSVTTRVVAGDGTTTTTGEYNSLALTGGDVPVISYAEASNTIGGRLMIAVCESATDCNTPTINIVDDSIVGAIPVSLLGRYTSLALNNSSYNLFEVESCDFGEFTNTITGDPKLGPLADNGGDTETHALLDGSPALDAGSSALTTDQRSAPRPFGLADDIGAYESQLIGTIIIAKQTAPANQGDFDFSHNITATTTFTLAGGQSETFLNVAPGTYTVTEEIEAGWRLVDLRCDDGNSARPSSGSTSTRTATIEVELGETVTCTFTNSEDDIIFVQKATRPAGGTGFNFTVGGDASTTFSLDDGGIQALDVVSGTYTLTETNPSPAYNLAEIDCTIFGPGPTDETPAPGNLATGSVDLTMSSGQAAFCLFTNDKAGTITIVKDADPADDTQFDFEIVGSPPFSNTLFSLQNPLQPSKTFTDVVPGVYGVTEGALAGWALTDIDCQSTLGTSSYLIDLPTRGGNITLAPGDDVTCTFSNTKLGTIFIGKTTIPATISPSFEFTQTIDPANGAFQLNHGGSSLPGCGAWSVHRVGDQRAGGLATERPDVQRRRQRHAFDGGPGDAHGDHQCGAG